MRVVPLGALVGVATSVALLGATADQMDASAECVAEVTSCADES